VPRAELTAVTREVLRGWPLPEPDDDGGKHDRGTVLVVGGASSTPGAVLLAGLAALRAGAGRLRVATVESTASALGVALAEAQVVGLPAGDGGSLAPGCVDDVVELAERADALVIGPGLQGHDDVQALLEGVLPRLRPDTRVLVDAVALTALARCPEVLDAVRGRVVLTPNAGECAALLDDDPSTDLDAARRIAERYGAVVALHGGTAAPDGRSWTDDAGGVGLGTSGSGDVLAGAVGGLLARGAEPAQAAVVGQHVHAAAGDRLAQRRGRLGFLARELLDELPVVLADLHR
jgi:ADP-dependent NAD(P)H-hydrate dehydratase